VALLAGFRPAIAQNSSASLAFRLTPVARGFTDPVGIASTPAEPSKLFVVEREGFVKVIEDGKLAKRALLDIEEILSPRENAALSSIAFPNDYSTNKTLYVSYTDKQGDTIIGRFPTKSSETANEDALMVVLKIVQPAPHTHRSSITFGEDKDLYITLGDAGRASGISSLAQNPRSLFGKVLRINLSDPSRYTIPSDNPFTKRSDAAPEVWAIGFQQPRNISFDPLTKRLLLIDSGREVREVDLVERGRNYGWNALEGAQCASAKCDTSAYVAPIFTYKASPQSAAIGGFVYHGSKHPSLKGVYLFADSATKALSALTHSGAEWKKLQIATTTSPVVAIGPGGDGEIYVATADGTVSTVIQ
jgi:glucose/arabinose dehydrogenase